MSTAIRVLLVEDHTDYRESLTALLNSSGRFDCTAFATAEEGLKAMDDLRPGVVLMDINLRGTGAVAGMDGIQCTRVIKERWPKVQVMMCTVYEDDEKIFDALKAGATGYLIKRAPIDELFDGIELVYKGGSPMSATIARKVVGSFQVRPEMHGEKLSEREMEVLDHLSTGLRMKEIADRLNLSTNTVRTHVRHIYEKLQVQSRTEALNKARWPRRSAG
jgi:DNA-binding NarL/FixJ family response regulator